METIQDVLICGGCGSIQAADAPLRLCACGSDHFWDTMLRLQASQFFPDCSRLHAMDFSPGLFPQRYWPECFARRASYVDECMAFEFELEGLRRDADARGLYAGMTRDGKLGLVDPDSEE